MPGYANGPDTGRGHWWGNAYRCAPGEIRTHNLLIRSQMLYPLSYGRVHPASGARPCYRVGAAAALEQAANRLQARDLQVWVGPGTRPRKTADARDKGDVDGPATAAATLPMRAIGHAIMAARMRAACQR
jgi:hypothetical protein